MGKAFSDINPSNIFLDQSPKIKEIKAKIMGSNQTYKPLHSKGIHKQNTVYGLREKICK